MIDRVRQIAIVTQDPANRGGVLRLVHYMHDRIASLGFEPLILHYASFKVRPHLSLSLANMARGRFFRRHDAEDYEFEGMRCRAMGAAFPEWEPRRLHASQAWKHSLEASKAAVLVTGSAHVGYPLVQLSKPYLAWVSSTVEADRAARLAEEKNFRARVERYGLSYVKDYEMDALVCARDVYAVSNDAANSIKRIVNREVEVLPFPVDTNFWRPAENVDTDKTSLLFVGRAIDPRKNVKLFLEAARVAQQRLGIDLPLDIVSDKLPEKLFTEGLTIRLHQNLDENALRELYRNAAALVMTSEQEGLGIAVMEAMSCGAPVISTRSGGPEMLIEDGISGYLTGNDPSEIAERILRVIENTEVRHQVKLEARKRMEVAFSQTVWNPRFDLILSNFLNSIPN